MTKRRDRGTIVTAVLSFLFHSKWEGKALANLYEAVKEWMETSKKTNVKPSTYDRLLRSLELMANYGISRIPFESVEASDIQDYLNRLVDDGYALSTVKKQYHLISAFIDYANANRKLNCLVYKGVNLPSESSVKKHKREVIAYSKREQYDLSQVLWTLEHPSYGAAILMMETGMRVGEVMALGWDDIDWNRRAVMIRKTAVRIYDRKRVYIQNEPKSFSSKRTIALSKNAMDLLTDLRRLDDSDSPFVFHDERGDFLTYECLRWPIMKACSKAKVPYYGQHVFRHTFATNCYEKGCDVKLLSKFLGHQNVNVTYNVYIHLFGDALEEMRMIVD